MLDKKLIDKFNTPNTLIFISKYPYLEISHSYHGVARYTKQVTEAIAEHRQQKCIILVQDEYHRPVQQIDDRTLVIPAFTPGVGMFGQLLNWVRRFDQPSIVHLHSEFYTSGDTLQMALIVPFIAGLRLLGKTVYFTIHNVVKDFNFLATHLNRSQDDLGLKVIKALTPWYYRAVGLVTNKVIALDDAVKDVLIRYIPQKKVHLSPLWIAPVDHSAHRKYWREKFGFGANDLVLVCFGFMTTYKGVDWLVDAINHSRRFKEGKKIRLILAGGKAPSQEGKPHYERFYNQLAQKVAKSTSLVLTGFIPDDELAHYFAAGDLVVLPYRGILGASASWAQAMAFEKPFILSEDLVPYLRGEDIQEALKKAGLDQNDLIFKRSKRAFAQKLFTLLKENKLSSMSQISSEVAKARSPKVRLLIEDELYTPQKAGYSVQLERAILFAKKTYSGLVA